MRILVRRSFKAIMKRYSDNASFCLTHLSILNIGDEKPLFGTKLDMSEYKTEIQLIKEPPPICPGFVARIRRLMWVEFVVGYLL